MDFINYFLASLISFFGLILGIILILIALEEQKPGKKYFIYLQNLFFILAIFFYLFYLKINLFIVFLIISLLIIYFLKIKIKDNFKKSQNMYVFLAIIFFFSLKDGNLFLIEAVLIFLFGVPTGSLLFDKKKKNYFKVVLRNAVFLVVGCGLFLISNFI